MKIFVQIAAYRDPQLIFTIKDMLDKAKHPENLVICIAHQYDDINVLNEYRFDKRFKIIDVPFQQSKGACWARNLIQQKYNGEEYTLQIDSHHRFVQYWDEILINMIRDLQDKGHEKPLLTAYLPSFDPESDPDKRINIPWKMNFDRFIPEGAIFFMPNNIDGYNELNEPVRSRFYSAHFCFTLGQFCNEVQHDPDYYFHGEEISIAVRAFTWGYDLFHPHRLIAWHEYTRKGRSKQWDDDSIWGERNEKCHSKNRKLFGMDGETLADDFGIYGFGKKRTLRDYEEYAGISFLKRGVQEYTLDNKYPPNPKYQNEDDFNKSFIIKFKYYINIDSNQFTENDYDFWVVAFHGKNNETIYRKDFKIKDIKKILEMSKIKVNFYPNTLPTNWIIWPHSKSKGWLEKIYGNL
jgi:hypothetical protein